MTDKGTHLTTAHFGKVFRQTDTIHVGMIRYSRRNPHGIVGKAITHQFQRSTGVNQETIAVGLCVRCTTKQDSLLLGVAETTKGEDHHTRDVCVKETYDCIIRGEIIIGKTTTM